MKIIKFILEIIGWVAIALSPTLAAGLIGLVVYVKFDNPTGAIIAILLVSLGFIFGAIWATIIWIKHGTIDWLSRIRETS